MVRRTLALLAALLALAITPHPKDIAALSSAPSAAGPSLVLRVAGISADSVYLVPGDAAPLSVVGKTAIGGTVTPQAVTWTQTAHCVNIAPSAAPGTVATAGELSCGLTAGWIIAEGTVSGVRVRDSAWVTRPSFAPGSLRDLCVTWDPKALWYAASDTTIALAIQGADRLIAANFVPDSAGPSYNWQGARLQYQMAAIACMPAYRTKNVTRGYGARWSSADTSRATVSSAGLVTVKRQGTVTVTVAWP